jgi:RNA polymerase sigma-70 factor (ECF subfamily)
MERVQGRDDVAFQALYDRYKAQLFVYCLRMLNDRDAAKDVLQEVFIRIHTRREKYEAGTNFNGWIHTIARNLSLNARRDAKDHSSFDEGMAYAANPSEPGHDVALRERLAEEIARLPEIYREALILREYEGRSYQEIVDILGVAMSTVKFRIFKAREILRERLSWSLDELPGGLTGE